MGVATGCGFKEVYRFPHTTYPYSSCICSFLQSIPTFLFIFKNVFRSFILYCPQSFRLWSTAHLGLSSLHSLSKFKLSCERLYRVRTLFHKNECTLIGASLSEPHTYRTAVQNPLVLIYIYIFIFIIYFFICQMHIITSLECHLHVFLFNTS